MDEDLKLERARMRVIDTITQNMNLYGITPSVGRLYGLLYFNEEPMSLDSMKDELGMSKTSMSTSVRQLQELKMVEKIWKKGTRKDLYHSVDDWYQTFTDYFSIKWRKGISQNIASINKSLEEVSELLESPNTPIEIKEAANNDKDRFLYALEYYDWLNRLIDTFETNEIFKFVPKQKDTPKN
ncbi:GbsR/MarR family transcriptional regulator [Pseudoneobacillus rhizosphaerae]|uniref:HTH-type transcriptional regulator n=1 Tax=Pseudoneobacillus rhizosphaerae TaxID=2880968 RepID=A0A9C7G638_9BACI|nr:GbsR/MarR family transcriptional regulator [Pseudoneobacillus rhizosphaerae]CAG9606370.1 HTH-type transcriptional repressor OpcR [Pseudoneobacillus rhizosphaerae]